ncbi:MAG TPA: hypothetical protein VGQ08_06095 [Nitrospiraceae bacterium]|jgi:hypothetical protein|nr:hypothetical protein [Nitrospiraceae bacterium]
MQGLPEELIQANAILDEYVVIHDAIFKFSWRKALPIPGLFKATDFGAHVRDLDRLASELAAITSSLKTESGSLEGSNQYTAALLEAVQTLREICGRLYEKSQGELSKYPMAEYNANLKAYEGLMNKCQELGVALNQHIRGESAQPEG